MYTASWMCKQTYTFAQTVECLVLSLKVIRPLVLPMFMQEIELIRGNFVRRLYVINS